MLGGQHRLMLVDLMLLMMLEFKYVLLLGLSSHLLLLLLLENQLLLDHPLLLQSLLLLFQFVAYNEIIISSQGAAEVLIDEGITCRWI